MFLLIDVFLIGRPWKILWRQVTPLSVTVHNFRVFCVVWTAFALFTGSVDVILCACKCNKI